MHPELDIEGYIDFLRECIPNAVKVFTNGNCTSFAMLLEQRFPGGTVMHNIDHSTYLYNGHHYDVTGIVSAPKGTKPLMSWGPWLVKSLMKNNYTDDFK